MDFYLEYSAAACIFLALLCLAVPLDWIISAITAALIHELCHCLAVICAGGKIHAVRIGFAGAVIEASAMSPGKTLVCVASGPLGSLGLLLFAQWMPKLSICGVVQGAFNLLPVYPLDGGRILSCLTEMLFSKHISAVICKAISQVTGVAFLTMGIWCAAAGFGIMPLIISLVFLSKLPAGKKSCKAGKLAVQ